jgi:TIM-barrel protein
MLKLYNPAILSAMAGITNGFFCSQVAKTGAGMVTLGGFSFDRKTLEAAKLIKTRGRSEFIIEVEELTDKIAYQVSTARQGKSLVSVNVRTASKKGLMFAAKVVQEAGADAFELNAHCRQKEILDLGGGQSLLENQKKLCQWISILKEHIDIPLIVKFRANVVEEVTLVKRIIAAGADVVHVDAMKPGYPFADLDVVKRIANSCDSFVIGNNSVIDIDSAVQMLEAGANAFSIARAAINKPEIVGQIGKAVLNKLEDISSSKPQK